PLFVFHTVNAFHDGSDLVVDCLAYDDGRAIIESLRVDSLLGAAPDMAKLVRVRMPRGQRRANVEPLSDVRFELPAISYRMKSGRQHRFVWGASISAARGDYASAIVRVDLGRGGEERSFASGGFVFGEPIFVARPDTTREDDGVLLAVGADPKREEAQLVALDAASLEPVARAFVDLPIPLGYHGSFQHL
ncbi:MAG: carotenoid oxygenase family protein, partial [Polyangiaceae bacterium]|nr:carotenoid oxygenase family protein [Polyangiaceae bacterium]